MDNLEESDKEKLRQLFNKIKICKDCDDADQRLFFYVGKDYQKGKGIFILGQIPGDLDKWEQELSGIRSLDEYNDWFKKKLDPYKNKKERVRILTNFHNWVGFLGDTFAFTDLLNCTSIKFSKENRKACRNYLEEELEILQPKIVITLGEKVRKIWKDELKQKYPSIKVFYFVHPSQIDPTKKWDTTCDVKNAIGLEDCIGLED